MPTAIGIVHKFFPQVTKVKDAKTHAMVEVTPHDTQAAAVRNHRICAMARACQRAFQLDGVIVARAVCYLIEGTIATRYLVPQRLRNEIITFDRGGSFMPGTYELLPPDQHTRLGRGWASRYKSKATVGSKKKRRQPIRPSVPRHYISGIRATLNAGRMRATK